jgi:hypothetical protein
MHEKKPKKKKHFPDISLNLNNFQNDSEINEFSNFKQSNLYNLRDNYENNNS